MLIVLFTSCRDDAPESPAEPVTPRAASSAGPSDPPTGEPEFPQARGDESPPPGPVEPPEGSSDATTAPGAPEQSETAAKLPEYPLQENPLAGCSLCHVDIEDEFVGSLHFEEKVGCVTCHGPSTGHAADENNEVKPDEVFARPDVNRLCEVCHECLRPKPEEPELTADGQRKVCIDCHGPHDVALASP
jgi:hypothetical protein